MFFCWFRLRFDNLKVIFHKRKIIVKIVFLGIDLLSRMKIRFCPSDFDDFVAD